MPSDSVYVRRDGVVATIHLNRPAKKNAFTADMWNLLRQAVEDADRDTAIKVIVVTGNGEAFSAGADIEELNQAHTDPKFAEVIATAIVEAQTRLARNRKPTIAKLRGAVFGGGCGIALNCDLRFADPTARFAISPAKVGIVYPFGDTKRLVETVGPARAKDMLFTGRILKPDEAMTLGLIDRLVSEADLDGAVGTYATQIAELSQYAIRAGKTFVQMALDGVDENDLDARRLFRDSFSGPDFKEGVSAFIQKRKPNFPFV